MHEKNELPDQRTGDLFGGMRSRGEKFATCSVGFVRESLRAFALLEVLQCECLTRER